MSSASLKAGALVAVTGIFALWIWISWGSHNSSSLPYALFYVLLLLQTFFSVQLFQTIAPTTELVQFTLDAILALLYFVVGFYIGSPILFPFFMTLFFLIAVIKYVLLLGTFPHPKLLRRKILFNQLGALLSFAVYGAAAIGFPAWAAWTYVAVFTLATVYLLFIRPLYRI